MLQQGISIHLACTLFNISETCYRYQKKIRTENKTIADWLLHLTQTHPHWGFGLCFSYLSTVKRFTWNHKRVYRIYRALQLNQRMR